MKSLRELLEVNTEDLPDIYCDMDGVLCNFMKAADYAVGGDFVTSEYMLAWFNVARMNLNIKFYAYTKAIGWMQDNEDMRPKNFRMIASYGSKQDNLITEETISANVVFHPSETKLPIDKNEFYAINDNQGSFSLLLHGQQKKDSLGSKALSRMDKENIKYSYTR